MTTGTSESESMAKSARSKSPTWWAEADFGSTRSSGKPGRTPRNGAPSTPSNTTTASPIGTAWRVDEFRRPIPELLLNGQRLWAPGRPQHATQRAPHVQ